MNGYDAAIDKLIAATEKISKVNEGDYYKDGLLYCGKCQTAKQTRITVNGIERTPYCLCRCEKDKRDQEYAESAKKKLQERIDAMRKVCFPDRKMTEWTFDLDDRSNEKISQIAERYVDNFGVMLKKGKGLLLYGAVGTGKTFIACCIANKLIDRVIPCLVTNFARLVNTISGMYDGRQDYIDGLKKYQLLVIDDLASERDTEYMNEIVMNIIDSRYRSGLPLIVTTNLTPEELKRPADVRKQRIYSRLFEMCIPVEVTGGDRRKKKLLNDYKEMEELLGL